MAFLQTGLGIFESVRSHSLKRSRPPAIVKCPIKRIPLHHAVDTRPINPPTKHQHVARLRLHHEMLHIDRALHATRLIRPLEMARNHSPILLQVEILRRR